MFSEQSKNELRDKLRQAEDGNRELMSFIKNLQQQEEVELSSMRNFLQNKITEDLTINNKHNEKNSVLFNEMVRLGQESEKFITRMNQMQNVYETKI